jgi:hypothetical protein
MMEQLAGPAGVFGDDEGNLAEHIRRARGEISEIAQRGGNDVQDSGTRQSAILDRRYSTTN